jgi:hypothetical protein
LPSKKRKPAPDERENRLFNLVIKRGWALSVVDPVRFFFDSIIALKRLNRFNLKKTNNGVSIFAGACGLFAFSGMFFGLARKILDHIKTFVDRTDVKAAFHHAYYDLLLNLFTGNWNHTYQEDLVRENLLIGDLQTVNFYILAYVIMRIEQGAIAEAKSLIDRMEEIAETYENDGFQTHIPRAGCQTLHQNEAAAERLHRGQPLHGPHPEDRAVAGTDVQQAVRYPVISFALS